MRSGHMKPHSSAKGASNKNPQALKSDYLALIGFFVLFVSENLLEMALRHHFTVVTLIEQISNL